MKRAKTIKALSDLAPDQGNANKGTERGNRLLEDSLREFGAGRSIVTDKHGTVIGGNKTLEQAAALGFDIEVVKSDGQKLVVVQRTDLDLQDGDDKARRLAYADNRIGQIDLEWDADAILRDMAAGVDLEPFFSKIDIDKILADAGLNTDPDDAPEPEIDKADELREKWGVERGQGWEVGRHRVMCGDCATDAFVVDAVLLLTDPPYGVKRDKGLGGGPFRGKGAHIPRRSFSDDRDSARPAREVFVVVLRKAKAAIIFGGNHFADILPQSHHWIVWDKETTMPTFGDCELAWTNVGRTSVKKYTVQYSGLIGKEAERFHPTQKPVKLFAEILSDYTKDGDTVYDPFLGSGTTMVAAEQLGRTCYGMEIEPKYVAVTLERMAAMGLEPLRIINVE